MIIGCDYHPSWQHISWVDTETGETGEQKLVHARGDADRFYRALEAPALIGAVRAATSVPPRSTASASSAGPYSWPGVATRSSPAPGWSPAWRGESATAGGRAPRSTASRCAENVLPPAAAGCAPRPACPSSAGAHSLRVTITVFTIKIIEPKITGHRRVGTTHEVRMPKVVIQAESMPEFMTHY